MIAQKLAGQVGVMFLLMAIGVFIRKKGIVSVESARQFSNFALFIITPSLLVNVFQRDFHPEMAASIALSALLVVVFHLLAALLTKPLFPHRGGRRRPQRRRPAGRGQLQLRLYGHPAHDRRDGGRTA